ncbi:MAG: type 4a pilus biogenesis protein PilO [Actinomycetota bacterium]
MNKRAPLIAAVAGVLLAVLVIFFLVMPKRAQVSEKQDELDQAEQQETSLQLTLAQLEAAREDAPVTNEKIRQIGTMIPPTEDQPGMILLLQSAADRAGVDPLSISTANPVAAEGAEYSTVIVTLDTSGTYFALEEFLYNLETLPRAAKVTSVSLTGGTTTAATTEETTTEETATDTTTATTAELTGQFTVEFFTTDISAGPNSVPGPSEDAAAEPATEGGA